MIFTLILLLVLKGLVGFYLIRGPDLDLAKIVPEPWLCTLFAL
jgi:hypothetical protein